MACKVCRHLRQSSDVLHVPDIPVVNLPVGGGRAFVGAHFGDLRVGHELGEHGAVLLERGHQPAVQLHVLAAAADRAAKVDPCATCWGHAGKPITSD